MRTRSLLRVAFDIGRANPSQLPPTFLLPLRARLHQATATASPILSQDTFPESQIHTLSQNRVDDKSNNLNPKEILAESSLFQERGSSSQSTSESELVNTFAQSSPPPKPLVLSKSLQALLPLLEVQRPHYISAHIHRFPYLLTPGDTVRLPFHMHGVSPGDVLRLNRASLLGSRDYTLKAGTNITESYDGHRTGEPQYLDERLFECRVRILGLDSGPMMLKKKTKRRNRKVKTVRSKHKFTMLKVMEVKVKGLEELGKQTERLILE